MEKIENLETVIKEKDLMIQELAERIKKLEEVNDENLNQSDEMNCTFLNPLFKNTM